MTHLSLARTSLLAGVAFALVGAAAPQPAPPAKIVANSPDRSAQCAALASAMATVPIPGDDVQVTSARRVEATTSLPAHCRVEGTSGQRIGAGGKTYGIRFALALPDDWNGRFLLQGGGGLNGTVHPPLGPVAAGDRPALSRGFAVIGSDSGHQGAVFDTTFLADQRAALDFAETSVRTVALIGKQIVRSFYGTPARHSYMTGCSTGGREGMLATQRYPELFDGVIVGAPAMRTGDSNLAVEYTQTLFNRAAPKDAQGRPIMSQMLTDANRQVILDGLLKQCDALDGLKDGMIENVAGCHFQPARLQCSADRREGCLSKGQVEALDKGFAGPRDATGWPVYAPMAFDTGIAAKPMGYLPTGLPGPFGPPSAATEIDIDARIRDIRNTPWQRLTDTNYWTNLNTFLDHGGKLMMYHGVSDFWFSPFATSDWYQRAAAANGPAFAEASRFYMVPGMLHCSGGNAFDRFDMLGALVDWVEGGKAPQAIPAWRASAPAESRPLCPYPSYAAYRGGAPGQLASFACAMPDPKG